MARNTRNQVVYGAPARVDLLPKRQRAELVHERTMPKLLLYIVASAALSGLIWASGIIPVTLADQRLAAAETASEELLAELGEYSDVQTDLSDLTSLDAARGQLTANEVQFADVRDEVVSNLSDGAVLAGFAGALVGSAADAGGQIDLGTLCVAETATITVEIVVDALSQAEAALRSLEELTGFSCVVSTETLGTEITAQIALGPEALSHRFSKEAQ